MTALDPTLVAPPPPPPPGPPPPPAHRGWGWLVGGGLFAMVVVGWGTWLTISLLGREVRTERTVVVEPVQTVDVHGNGAIRVVAGDVERVRVTERIERSLVEPDRSLEVRRGVLLLSSSCSASSNFCSVDYELVVPPGTALRLRTDGGGIRVEGIDGAVDADTSGGGIAVVGGSGRLELDASGGGVSVVESRSAEVDASSSAGGIDLDFRQAPRLVQANSSGGGVTVVLPRTEASYAVEASASGGGTDVQVRTDPVSPRRVDVRSSGGGVTVRYA